MQKTLKESLSDLRASLELLWAGYYVIFIVAIGVALLVLFLSVRSVTENDRQRIRPECHEALGVWVYRNNFGNSIIRVMTEDEYREYCGER